MPREPIWRSIANTLQTEIAQELYRPGDKLPTEAELADRFAQTPKVERGSGLDHFVQRHPDIGQFNMETCASEKGGSQAPSFPCAGHVISVTHDSLVFVFC
jgi:hypothetical protein